MRSWTIRVGTVLALPLLLALLAAAAAWWLLRGSLPLLDGEQALPGLGAPATLERDALGTVTITADSEHDALRALGYVHAQERFFEMDTLRRAAAGELAALLGAGALPHDEAVRVHRLRQRVRGDFDAFAGPHRSRLLAYREGVNSGLADLRVRPWPYLLLRGRPEPWLQEDTALVGYAMFFDLQDHTNRRKLALSRMRAAVPEPLYRLIDPEGSSWDAPLMGQARGDSALPGPEELDLRALPHVGHAGPRRDRDDEAAVGSNSFAVSGALTADGRALVADDMHLGLRAPNLWFRARLVYPDRRAPGGRVDVSGLSLPGVPGIIVGSNGHVAWGFTNSYGDWAEWILLNDEAETEVVNEIIAVRGVRARTLEVELSAFGPVLERTADGRRLALYWQAHERGAIRLNLLDAARAPDLETLLELAPGLGLPAQNLLAGDRGGAIAWTLAGPRLPRMLNGYPLPQDDPFEAALAAPVGRLPARAHPVVRGDRLWTANARIADGATLAMIGDGGYDLGARQAQIRDALQAGDVFTEADLLAIQLDDRALFLERWYRLLRESVQAEGDDPALDALEAASREWSGRADIASTSYRLTRGFRDQVRARVLDGLMGPVRAALGDEFAVPRLPQFEGSLWPLVEQRPAHLLPPDFDSWEALLADAARAVVVELGEHDLQARTWGERNTSAICHPLAASLPAGAGRRLCMPREPLPGDRDLPRVQSPRAGASQRMVVAPGHEADGILHMPGGQSGHPLSPFWGAGHEDWAQGRPSPFLPGSPRHRLELRP